ncbi:MAG TPA: Asp-tRNA(Asn)/Glu-tRNA(Gln) amidotransferase subunit GatB [Gemmatimonadales bacterium]
MSGTERWETVIGLETHVQLRTRSKMFCGCSSVFGAPPNTNVCPVCLGLPGALPTVNEQAIRLAVRAALALGCRVQAHSVFARKNYFYPDLPKGYQISQYEEPLATDGALAFVSPERGTVTATIVRLHVEEDAGKSLHDRIPGATAVDLNRSGVPLAEIVTGPDFRSPQEARAYLLALKEVLQYADVSDCDLEKGSLRVDANLSVRPAGHPELGTKTEVKNINSFAFVEKALGLERDRQIATLMAGGRIEQQTMLFDAKANAVRPQRSKEESKDYRYFPEPDLPPLVVPDVWLEEERAILPELPAARRQRFATQYGLPAQDTAVLVQSREIADYFEATVAAGAEPKPAANWVMGEVLADAKNRGGALRVTPDRLARLVALVKDGTVSNNAAKQVFAALADNGSGDPRTTAERLGLLQVADAGALTGWVEQVLAANAAEVERYRKGEAKLLPFFVGQVMKASKGKADPTQVPRLLKERLGG